MGTRGEGFKGGKAGGKGRHLGEEKRKRKRRENGETETRGPKDWAADFSLTRPKPAIRSSRKIKD